MRLNSAKIEIDSRLKLENVTHNMVEHMLTSIFAIGFKFIFYEDNWQFWKLTNAYKFRFSVSFISSVHSYGPNMSLYITHIVNKLSWCIS